MLRDEIPTIRGPVPDLPEREVAAPDAQPMAVDISVAGAAAGESAPRRVGKYELLFPLAEGGMGAVHVGLLAEGRFESVVAIKTLHARDRRPEELEAFVREAKISAKISHKNVLGAFELGFHEAEPFLVMPLVRGVSLSRLMRELAEQGRLLAPELAAWIAGQVADGLQAAHELCGDDEKPLGLVHRDVSPQNVLLGFDGHVWLLDFGVAKLYESARSTETGVVKGKFGYMAPEQCAGGNLDNRADVFALGIVLHEMLTGRELFANLPPAVAALRITTARAPAPSTIRPDLPKRLDALTERAMRLERQERFVSAAALAHDLRSYLEQAGGAQGDAALAKLLGELFSDQREALAQRLSAALAASRAARREPSNPSPTLDSERSGSERNAPPWRVGVLLGAALVFSAFGAVALQWYRSAPAPAATAGLEQTDAPSLDLRDRDATAASAMGIQAPPTPASAPPMTSADTGHGANRPGDSNMLPSHSTAPALRPFESAATPAPLPAAAPSAQFKGEPFRSW